MARVRSIIIHVHVARDKPRSVNRQTSRKLHREPHQRQYLFDRFSFSMPTDTRDASSSSERSERGGLCGMPPPPPRPHAARSRRPTLPLISWEPRIRLPPPGFVSVIFISLFRLLRRCVLRNFSSQTYDICPDDPPILCGDRLWYLLLINNIGISKNIANLLD